MSRCRGATIHPPGHTAILLWPRLAHVDSQFSGLDFLCSDLPWRICVATCTHSAAWCRSSTAAIRTALWSWSWETGWTTAGVWRNRTFWNDNFLVVFFFFLRKILWCFLTGSGSWPSTMTCWVFLTSCLSSGLQCSSQTLRTRNTSTQGWSLWAGYGDQRTLGACKFKKIF